MNIENHITTVKEILYEIKIYMALKWIKNIMDADYGFKDEEQSFKGCTSKEYAPITTKRKSISKILAV